MFPLTRYTFTGPVLILMSIGLVIAQMLLTQADVLMLWVNWGFAGLMSFGIWYVVKLFHLAGLYEGKAFTIGWPLMSACLNFALCYIPGQEHSALWLLLQFILFALLSLVLSTWQQGVSVGRYLLVGLLIGAVSTQFPPMLLWSLLLPVAGYHMRSWSVRNVSGSFTGILLGIWIMYCVHFFSQSMAEADQMLRSLLSLFVVQGLDVAAFGLWHWLLLSLIVLLTVVYSLSSMVLRTVSIRASASIATVSTFGLAAILFALLDLDNLPAYLGLLSLLLSLQLTTHQSNLHSSFHEWWTIVILLLVQTLSLLPLVLPIG